MAEETNAVERYLLDEFTPEERGDFEAHLFDCAICGDRVRQSAIAIANVKEVLGEERKYSEESHGGIRNQGWASWFRAPALIPSVVALALATVTAYQSWVYIPRLEQPRAFSSIETIAPAARGDGKPIQTDGRRPMFVLSFEMDSAPQDAYTCDFRREGGAVVLKMACDVASDTLAVLLPTTKFPTGRYDMILRAAKPGTEIQRYSFAIERGQT